MVSVSEYTYSLKDFCLSTTIHGFYYIAHTKGIQKVLWWLVWLTMLMFMLWSCVNNIIGYCKLEVKTDIAYQREDEIEFPAITFCSQFGLSKSKISSNQTASVLLAYLAISTYRMEDISYRFTESERLCNMTTKSHNDNKALEKLMGEGVFSMFKKLGWNALDAVKKCWWNNVEMECHGLFANMISDNGACFVFMPIRPSDEVFQKLLNVDNELNKSLLVDRRITFGGPNNGLRILMDVGQDDKCDTVKKYEGAGFIAVVHDRLSLLQLFSVAPSFTLTPGYEIDVILKPTVFRRNTAHLGKCRMPVYTYLNSPFYFKITCIYFCMYKMIVQNCNCYLKTTSTFDNDVIENAVGINISKFVSCKADQSLCVKEQEMRVFSLDNMDKLCPYCIQPCFETKYDTLLTYKKISLYVGKYFEKNVSVVHTNVAKIRKNYLMVNFYFNSMTVLHVNESQKITVVDVLIYFGGAIGLFLGASYMSLNEIVQLLVHSLIKKLAKNRHFQGQQMKVLLKHSPNQTQIPLQVVSSNKTTVDDGNETRTLNTNSTCFIESTIVSNRAESVEIESIFKDTNNKGDIFVEDFI